MSHSRQNIRDAVVAALIAGNTAAGAEVYASAVYPTETVPAIIVYSLNETAAPGGFNFIRRELTLTITARAAKTSEAEIDEVLDDLAAEIETLMKADRTFGRLCTTSYLSGTEITLTDEAEKPKGSLDLTYKFIYQTTF